MKEYFTNIKFIIMLSMITSGSFGSDQLNEVIAEEEGNISYRNSIDFDTKTTQVWWDSAWHNKWQWLKSYDNSGYLTESEFYKFRDDEWLLRGNVSYTNNESGAPTSRIRQVYWDGSYYNRSLHEYNYNDGGDLTQNTRFKWRHDSWHNRSLTELQYQDGLCVDNTNYRWVDSTWANRYLREISYNNNGERAVKVGYKWTDSGWTERHKTEYSYDVNGDLSQKMFSKWTNADWVTRARLTISRDNALNPVEILLEKVDSTDTWHNVSLRENAFSNDGMIMETVKSRWRNEEWRPRKRNEYTYVNGPGRSTLSIVAPATLPDQITLAQNYPNPFNPNTTFSYELPEEEFVRIAVFDMRGNRVATLVNERQDPGVRSYRWNGTNDIGDGVAAGVYIYTIQAGNFRQSKKMILLK
tara:strand:+ start:703 stop:1938 length:1236 start_codon:yes stop_codon:yes gene_type:complete